MNKKNCSPKNENVLTIRTFQNVDEFVPWSDLENN